MFAGVIGIAAGIFAVLAFACEVTNLTAVLGMVAAFCLGLLWGSSEDND